MIRLLLKSTLLFLIIFISGCSAGQHENEATKNLSAEDKMHYEQYMVQGETLYNTYCSNCHQKDGTGLRRLIPPLVQSDYLLKDEKRTVCIIRNGIQGHISVNNIDFNQKMPANKDLKDIEIAQITTFIYNSWGNEKGYISVGKTSTYLNACHQ